MQIPSPELRLIALSQSGLITTGQARGTGFGEDALERMVRDGHWRRCASGLYDTAPGPDAVDKRIWSAVLQADWPCAVGGEAALSLHGLERSVGRVVVWVPPDRRPRSGSGLQVRRDKLGRIDRALGSPPRIRVEDALVDVGQHLDVEALVALLADANRLRVTTLARVRGCVDSRRRVRHRELFLDILSDLVGIESTLEYVYRRDIERAHGLPVGRRQNSVSSGTRTDVVYEEYGLLIELDGRFGHVDGTSAFRDLRRDNAHAVRRLFTLRYGSADVRGKACEIARQVGTALQVRGWPGVPRGCSSCEEPVVAGF
jgi:hypothetical protein